MKKLFALLLALALLLSLAACGEKTGAAPAEDLTRGGMPEEEQAPAEREQTGTILDPEDLDLDLSICQPEEVYREIEHLNIDPTGYVGLRLRVTGEVFRSESHDKTFYYVGVRDDDGCVENLELRFPGDGQPPRDFPEDGSVLTVWGRMSCYSTERDGKKVNCAVLTDVQFTEQTDFRD